MEMKLTIKACDVYQPATLINMSREKKRASEDAL